MIARARNASSTAIRECGMSANSSREWAIFGQTAASAKRFRARRAGLPLGREGETGKSRSAPLKRRGSRRFHRLSSASPRFSSSASIVGRRPRNCR